MLRGLLLMAILLTSCARKPLKIEASIAQHGDVAEAGVKNVRDRPTTPLLVVIRAGEKTMAQPAPFVLNRLEERKFVVHGVSGGPVEIEVRSKFTGAVLARATSQR